MTLSWAPRQAARPTCRWSSPTRALSNSTEFGSNWSAPYHLLPSPTHGINPHRSRSTPQALSTTTPTSAQRILFVFLSRTALTGNKPPQAGPRPSPTAQASITTAQGCCAGQGPSRRPLDPHLGQRLQPRAGNPGSLWQPHIVCLQCIKLRQADRGPGRPDHVANGQCQKQRSRADRPAPSSVSTSFIYDGSHHLAPG